METLTEDEWNDLYYNRTAQVFNPHTPVDVKDLFSGRRDQMNRVIDAVFQKGQHAIIYGERGVGKTSLANVLAQFAPGGGHNLISARVNADGNDSFKAVWTKVFDELNLVSSKSGIGFTSTASTVALYAKDFLGEGDVTPDSIRRALLRINPDLFPILIIDEFDRLPTDVSRLFADLIKNLSDHALKSTVVIIGVGDSIDQLISEHQSISRALIEIQMPRMTPSEIKNIITNGISRLGMKIDEDVLNEISVLSQGLPYYAHLLGLHSCRSAIEKHSLEVREQNLQEAINVALESAQKSIKTKYHGAISSAHTDNLFAEVLLACALAKKDALGTFAATDVEEPLEKITGKQYGVASFARHLDSFCSDKRGNVLLKSGEKRNYRYRFADALMQPYVIMCGTIKHKIKLTMISE